MRAALRLELERLIDASVRSSLMVVRLSAALASPRVIELASVVVCLLPALAMDAGEIRSRVSSPTVKCPRLSLSLLCRALLPGGPMMDGSPMSAASKAPLGCASPSPVAA